LKSGIFETGKPCVGNMKNEGRYSGRLNGRGLSGILTGDYNRKHPLEKVIKKRFF
jgi:hypothetical protein